MSIYLSSLQKHILRPGPKYYDKQLFDAELQILLELYEASTNYICTFCTLGMLYFNYKKALNGVLILAYLMGAIMAAILYLGQNDHISLDGIAKYRKCVRGR